MVDHPEPLDSERLHPVVLPWVLDLPVHLGRSDMPPYQVVGPAGRSVGSVVALLESVAMCPLVDFMGRHRNGLVVLADHLDDAASEAQCWRTAGAPVGPAVVAIRRAG